MTVDPSGTNYADIYKLMIGAIVPRPIAFVSTLNAGGGFNLAPFSFFTGISANPPVICFCPMIRYDGTRKDTLRNIDATREFVVNVVSEEIVQQMNLCSPEYPPDVDEFQVSGLTPIASDIVRAPRVKESHISMECRLLQIIEISAKPLGGNLVLGEILRFHVDDALFENYRIDPDKLHAIGRMAGTTYVRTTDRFDLNRPARVTNPQA